jgi:3D (Asp-Asp-Asp) domain-containing protein
MSPMRIMLMAILGLGAGVPVSGLWTSQYDDYNVSAYCCCTKCTKGLGITASGRDARGTRGVAVDRGVVPLGSRLDIPGYGTWVQADDTGSAIKGRMLDLRMTDHQQAKNFGRKTLRCRVWRRREVPNESYTSQ